MARIDLMSEVLGHLADGTSDLAEATCLEVWEREADPAALGLAAVAAFWLGNFARGTAHARAGLAAATDDEARGLCRAAAALAAAGDPTVLDDADWSAAAGLLAKCPDPESPWWSAVRYLAAEAALVSARIDAARDVAESGPAALLGWVGHRFAPIMWVCQVRIAVFSGRIDDAAALLEPARRSAAPDTRVSRALDSVAGLVLGNAGDPEAVAGSLAVADHVPGVPRDFVDRGTLLLLAFGAIAVGDVATAAAMTFRAGADEALSRCTMIDRALGLELLLVAALDEADADAAAAWVAAMDELATHPISAPTVARARARAALEDGEVDRAIALLTASVADCTADGRRVEAAEGEIVLARARIAARDLGAASRGLRILVADSDRTGHAAVRRSAGATLSSSGRRLPPIAGAGWSALSVREAEVARAILAGLGTDQIAATLFLSPATVRVHISRVLCAFGVATRIGLLAVTGDATDDPSALPPPLSPRQAEVAALVAAGHSNKQLAEALGISVKGVEKHVSDILVRWSAGSRFELARIWWAGARASAVCDTLGQSKKERAAAGVSGHLRRRSRS